MITRLLARSVLILFVLSLFFFGFAHLLPGGICALYPQKTVGACSSSLGLDEFLPFQYARWLGTYLHGNLGTSPDGSPIGQEILGGIPASVVLLLGGTVLYLLVRPALARVIRRRDWRDRLESPLWLIVAAIPIFWLGILLIYGFAIHWSILPSGGVDSPNIPPLWSDAWFAMIPKSPGMMLVNLLKHLVLPSILLAVVLYIADQTASTLSLAAHNGRHAPYRRFIGNLPIFLSMLISGIVIVEYVFSYDGLGLLLVKAIGASPPDYAMALDLVMLGGLLMVLCTLVANIVGPTTPSLSRDPAPRSVS